MGEQSCEIISNLDQWIRRCCLKQKFTDGRMTDEDRSQQASDMYHIFSLITRYCVCKTLCPKPFDKYGNIFKGS